MGAMPPRSHAKALAALSLCSFLLPGLFVLFSLFDYRINMTRSAPVGLWRIEPLERAARAGDRIFICPPDDPAFQLALDRHYLPRGLCASGSAPLIKTIVALGGQSVQINEHILIDGQALPSSNILTRDPQGRAITPWSGGVLSPDTLFLFSDFAGSYDSRYFGPLPADNVLGLAREVLTIRL